MVVAACFETTDDATEVFLHLLLKEKDAVQVVGHHLQRYDLNLRIIAGNAPPFVTHPLPQLAKRYARGLGAAFGRLATSHHLPEERTAALGHHRHQIHHALRVVVTHTAALHRGLLLARKCLLALVNFALHVLSAKILFFRYSTTLKSKNVQMCKLHHFYFTYLNSAQFRKKVLQFAHLHILAILVVLKVTFMMLRIWHSSKRDHVEEKKKA